MLVYEMKLKGTKQQYECLDQVIRTGTFVRNSIIRAWMDGIVKSKNEAYKQCKVLADDPQFPWAKKLNSMARQAHSERAWASVEKFYRNCKAKIPGKKGYPKFKKYQVRASVEYKTSGWKLSSDRRYLKLTDGFKAGNFKLWGSRNLHYYQIEQIKRVRIIRRHDGYYAQVCIDHTRVEKKPLTGKNIGLDVGLAHFYTDSDGKKVENPRFLRRDECKIKKLQRRLSRKQKGSKNRIKARNRLGRAHLKVARRRNDWVCKLAQRVIQSSDLVAIENLQVRNMLKNHCLAKSISDAAWTKFREWLEYFGKILGVRVIAVNPKYTSQDCSNCGTRVVKTLSTRTHKCPHCGFIVDRDENAAINVLEEALRELASTLGHKGTEPNALGENPLCMSSRAKTRDLELETKPCKGTRRKRKSQQ